METEHRAFVHHGALSSDSADRRDRDASDPFASADPAHAFVRFPFDAHGVGVDRENRCHARLHHLAMRRNLRAFGDDRDIYLVYDPSECSNSLNSRAEHLERIFAFVRGIAVGKHLADIPRARGAEDRVGDRMGDRVTVRVSLEMYVARNGNAAEDEWSWRREA